MFRIAAATLCMAVLSGVAGAQNPADFIYNPPMRSSTLNGNMFTNETEILTPQGIIDSPDEQFFLMQQPAAGPDEPDVAQDPFATQPDAATGAQP